MRLEMDRVKQRDLPALRWAGAFFDKVKSGVSDAAFGRRLTMPVRRLHREKSIFM
jgi:hypothetical protein